MQQECMARLCMTISVYICTMLVPEALKAHPKQRFIYEEKRKNYLGYDRKE